MSNIVAFLQARLDEDERIARLCLEPEEMHPYGDKTIPPIRPDQVADEFRGYLGGSWGEHAAHNEPGRVLREVAAKRAIVTAFRDAVAQRDAEWLDYCNWLDGKASDGFSKSWPRTSRGNIAGLSLAVRAFAGVYSQHPDFDRSWVTGTPTS